MTRKLSQGVPVEGEARPLPCWETPPEHYLRRTFHVGRYLRAVQIAAQTGGFQVEHIYAKGLNDPLLALHRPCPNPHATLYLSAGMHGDEPAGSLALLRMIRHNRFPPDLALWIFPLLNPSGMRLNQRGNASGIDINRDYRRFETPEARAHRDYLSGKVRRCDLAVLLHEDWEARGFYLYEINPTCEGSVAEAIFEAVRPWLPVDPSPTIDGHPAVNGLVRPDAASIARHLPGDTYPEALWLVEGLTRHSYTLETPSNHDLLPRMRAHEAAIANLIEALKHQAHLFDI